MRRVVKGWSRLALATALAGSPLYAENLSFVTCPIVRDTKTTPCWLAEYNGETYFLGLQGGVAQDYYPPQLNHRVLVEGTIAEGPRVCGGIPLRPVKNSVLLEIDRACNTILPAEDAIEPPQRTLARGTPSWVRSDGPGDSTLFFDFDNDFLSLHTTRAVQAAVEYFRQSGASRIEVAAFPGASRLSNGTVMTENAGLAAERAAKVRDILLGLGVPGTAVNVQIHTDAADPDGVNDPWSRKVTLLVKP
jgi:hypothetical protein